MLSSATGPWHNWQALFFDCDGVLVDSVEVKSRAFGRLFESYGPEITEKVMDHHRRHSGVTRVDKFRYYYREFLRKPLEEEELGELCRRFARLVVDEVVAAPEIPGVEAFLREVVGQLPCFVVSAAPEPEVQEILQRRGWDGYFREILGAPRGKRENLAFLVDKYSLNPQQCWFFGDAGSDYHAAQACGVQFLGVVPGPEAPLLQIAPNITWVRDFTEPLPVASKD